ncbi:hypothetical protein RFI_11384 [Reticulomyxa filosa]|uniref:Uncharacterized protein n=1 Tax=Reticulomyxa filosa TaxID=46433 RepID=X6NID5_RETFI|nr:hypothetical protein RFI_11384 [Reticulomyxa filosa]|eukprot:ETO25751.1 hypothetical protein RFI_11384 [Reticulomyxa filosa]
MFGALHTKFQILCIWDTKIDGNEKTNNTITKLTQELEKARLENADLQNLLISLQQQYEELLDSKGVNNNSQHKEKQMDGNQNNTRTGYPMGKLTKIIDVMEEEVRMLKMELLKKDLEIKRLQKQINQKYEAYINTKLRNAEIHITFCYFFYLLCCLLLLQRMEEIQKNTEIISVQLWEEREKNKKISKEFEEYKNELESNMQKLKASHIQMCEELNAIKDEDIQKTAQINLLRKHISKSNLYGTSPPQVQREYKKNTLLSSSQNHKSKSC